MRKKVTVTLRVIELSFNFGIRRRSQPIYPQDQRPWKMLDFVYIVEPLSQSSASSQTRIFMEMKSDYPLWNFDAAVDAVAFL